MSTAFPTVKNGLHFRAHNNGFICQELVELPVAFTGKWEGAQIERAIDTFFAAVAGVSQKRYATAEERESVPEGERIAQGKAIVEDVVASIKASEQFQAMSLFERFMFALGQWWYYHPVLMRETVNTDMHAVTECVSELAEHYLIPALPGQVVEVLQYATIINVAVGFGHFAILFTDKDEPNRFIVTDQQLIMLPRLHGYNYLDITQDGSPVVRCSTQLGGGRAFFDGIRLMTHDMFQTCAPKTVLVDGGYKVNSTRCTIINGVLYPLVDTDDKVAHTTGAWGWGPFSMVDFTRKDQAEASELAEQSASRIHFRDGQTFLGEQRLKPVGFFYPSETTLLQNGFTRYEPSEFEEIISYRYDHVLAVDDREDWLDHVSNAFGKDIPRLETFQTADKQEALGRILADNPEALILDVHLTPDEQFDGLWIANQLIANGYGGLIMLASSYGDEALRAMQTLVKGKTKAPGKDIGKVRLCLRGKG